MYDTCICLDLVEIHKVQKYKVQSTEDELSRVGKQRCEETELSLSLSLSLSHLPYISGCIIVV